MARKITYIVPTLNARLIRRSRLLVSQAHGMRRNFDSIAFQYGGLLQDKVKDFSEIETRFNYLYDKFETSQKMMRRMAPGHDMLDALTNRLRTMERLLTKMKDVYGQLVQHVSALKEQKRMMAIIVAKHVDNPKMKQEILMGLGKRPDRKTDNLIIAVSDLMKESRAQCDVFENITKKFGTVISACVPNYSDIEFRFDRKYQACCEIEKRIRQISNKGQGQLPKYVRELDSAVKDLDNICNELRIYIPELKRELMYREKFIKNPSLGCVIPQPAVVRSNRAGQCR